jgi:hypothetical protein
MNVFAKVRRTNGQPEKHNEEQPVANFEPPPLTPVRLHGYADTAKIRLLDDDLCEEIRHLLPARLQLYDSWQLMYSLEQHGASLGTLYNRLRLPTDKRPGYIMVIKDKVGSIFGAYVNEAYKPTDTRRFYGNGECFLWKLKKQKSKSFSGSLEESDMPDRYFQAFPFTGLNDFVIFCTHRFLSMGGGDGHYGLWLDDNLDKGVSDRSLTFGNDPLSDNGSKFNIIALEVWRVQ